MHAEFHNRPSDTELLADSIHARCHMKSQSQLATSHELVQKETHAFLYGSFINHLVLCCHEPPPCTDKLLALLLNSPCTTRTPQRTLRSWPLCIEAGTVL
jgi:hypothetical protein